MRQEGGHLLGKQRRHRPSCLRMSIDTSSSMHLCTFICLPLFLHMYGSVYIPMYASRTFLRMPLCTSICLLLFLHMSASVPPYVCLCFFICMSLCTFLRMSFCMLLQTCLCMLLYVRYSLSAFLFNFFVFFCCFCLFFFLFLYILFQPPPLSLSPSIFPPMHRNCSSYGTASRYCARFQASCQRC